MGLSWRFEAAVAADADDVYAWMTDFREDDHASPAFHRGAGVEHDAQTASTRRIVSREGDVVTLEDSWGRRRFRTTATLVREQREVRIRGEGGYHAAWRAVPTEEGARVTCEGEMRGVFGALAKLLSGKKMLAQMERDFNGHVEDLRETVASRPISRPFVSEGAS